jgi:hypothetical protein
MSDLPQDSEQDPSTATMHPALQAFQDAIPDSAAEAPWAQEVTTRLNDWVQKRDMADANEAAANQYTANIGDFKSGLVNMVTADPTAHQVALDIVDPTLHQLMPYDYMDPSKHAETHGALADDIKYQIAHASVASMARRDGPAARSLMDSPAISEHLDDQDKAGLSGYIQAHEVARGADAAADQREAIIQAQRQATATQHGYAASMLNPDTGQVQFPKGWGQRLTDDPSLRPEDRGELMHMYGRLQAEGDGKRDPEALRLAIQDIARGTDAGGFSITPNYIFGSTGGKDGMKLADAVWLNGLLNTESTEGQIQRQQLADTVAKAQAVIYGGSGENAVGGHKAFGRFMDWFIPAYQKAGPAGLDPTSDKFLFNGTNINAFRPTNDDIVIGSKWGTYPGANGMSPISRGEATEDNPDKKIRLDQIFGGRKAAPGDEVIRSQRTPPVRMPTGHDDGPGENTPFYANSEQRT